MAKKHLVSWAKCKLSAGKKLPFKSNAAIERMASYAGFTIADAYRCGAEEAQNEIMRRLNELRPADSPEPNPKRGSPPFPEVEAAVGGGNSPDVSNAHSANEVSK